MLLLILLTLHVSDVNGEVCAEFSFESSHYKATFVEVTRPPDYRTWSEIKEMCDEDYELVSITSAEENNVILDMLEDCTDGGYAIGLSRDAGVERQIDSNWNWESGQTAAGLFWYPGEPNVHESYCAFAYILTTNPEHNTWADDKCTDKFGTWIGSQGYGYICEKQTITTTQPTTEYHPLITTEPDNQGGKISSEVATTQPTTEHHPLITEPDNQGEKNSSKVATIQPTTEYQPLITTEPDNQGEKNSSEVATIPTSVLPVTVDNGGKTHSSGVATTQPTTEYHPLITTEPGNQGEKNSSEVATTPISILPVTVDNEGKSPSSGEVTTQPTTEYQPLITTGTEPDNQGEKNSSEVATNPTSVLPVTVDNEGKTRSSGVATKQPTTDHSLITTEPDNQGEQISSEVDILLIVAPSSSVVVIIILLVFLYSCRNQLCCKRITGTKPEYNMMDGWIEPPVNEHNVVNYAYCSESIELKGNPSIQTQQDVDKDKDKDNNMNVEVTSSDDTGLLDAVTEENPNYYKMDLMYTTFRNREMEEGEVDNPAYAALPFEPEYDSVEKADNVTQTQCRPIKKQNHYATFQYDENNQEVDKHTKPDMKKRNGYEEVGALMKTGEMAKNDASLDQINPVTPNDAQENVCSIDDEKLQCNDLYAKPDMKKKRRKGQNSVSNTIPSKTENSLRTTAVVMPTDNMYESVGERKDGYKQVDLVDFIPETKSLLDKAKDANELNSDIDSLYAKPDMTKKRAQTSTRKTIGVDGNYTNTNENANVSASGPKSRIVFDSGTDKETVEDGNMASSCNPEKTFSICLTTNTIDSEESVC